MAAFGAVRSLLSNLTALAWDEFRDLLHIPGNAARMALALEQHTS